MVSRKRKIYFKKLTKYYLRIKQKTKKSNECIIWNGAHDNSGYGRIWIKRNGKQSYVRVHRITYALKNKVTLAQLDKYHLGNECENLDCVNSKHWTILREVPPEIDRRPKKPARAGRGKETKLQIVDILKIKKLINKKIPFRRIAKKYKVEVGRIYKIHNEEIFKHVKYSKRTTSS